VAALVAAAAAIGVLAFLGVLSLGRGRKAAVRRASRQADAPVANAYPLEHRGEVSGGAGWLVEYADLGRQSTEYEPEDNLKQRA
jgi:hypothetical protein